MDRKVKEQYIAMVLDKVWRKYSDNIILQAIVGYAYCEKSTQETINKKVNNRLEAINAEIKAINPNYNETLKKYDVTKAEILDSLTQYEDALRSCGTFYDVKIQKLLIDRVEYETRKLGLLLKDEYLEEKTELREESKINITNKITNTIKNIMGRVMPNKEQKQQIDVSLYNDAMDVAELQATVQKRVEEKLEHVHKSNEENNKVQVEIEVKIKQLTEEIEKVNKEKIEFLNSAMDSTEKWIAISNVKPSLGIRIKNFVVARISTAKVVHNRIIIPFNQLINEFKNSQTEKFSSKATDIDSFKKEVEKIKSKTDKDYKKYRDLNLDKVKQANEIVQV